MFRQILVPSKENATITLPAEWYGREVEVIIFPLEKPQQSKEKNFRITSVRTCQVLSLIEKKQMQDKAFIEANVFIYYQRSDCPEKQSISKSLLENNDCVASTQVCYGAGETG